jgi:sulfur relay (sulfurtransferase) complex TusBCD TusD component (DsrE family)
MNRLTALAATLILFAGLHLSAGDPLFINMTADEPHRALMAIGFGKNQLERGHGLTLFLNDRGVAIASRLNGEKFKEQQKMLQAILAKGGVIYVCPMCMKQYGVKEADLLSGLKISSPDHTGAALFAANTRTLSW